MAKNPEELPADVVEDTQPDSDVSALQSRIEELEAENEQLKQVAVPAASSGRGRNVGAIMIALVAAVVLALAVPAVWMNRMITDTDVYVATVAPLAQDPDIQNAVAAKASEVVIERVDAQERLKQVLPENLQILAVPVSQAVNEFISKQATVLVRSDQFANIWEQVNRVSHKALVAAVTGRDTGVVGVQAGTITLDVGALAEELKARLEAAGLGFVANLPTSSIDRSIVLYESPMLAQMSSAFDVATRVALWLPIIGFVLAAVAIAVASDRRKAVLWLGGGLAIAAMLPLQALYFSQTYVTAQLYSLAAIPTPAAQAAFEIIFRDFVTADQAAIALGVVLWLGALVAGPARWAVAMRTGLSGGLSGVASHLELGRFGEWVRARKSALRLAGIGIALVILFLLPAPRTVASIVWLGLGYLLWLLLVGLFGAEPLDPESAAAIEAEAESADQSAIDPQS